MTTREIPDRFVTGVATDSRTVQTTGSAFVAGAQARGYLLFDNSGDTPITVYVGTTFNTLSGVSIQTTESVEVPAQQNGQDGTITAGAIAVNAGSAGNIPVNALVRRCCHGLFVSNPARFSGGVDAHQVRVVSQADLDGVRGNLRSALQQQVLKLLLKKMAPGEAMAQLPDYSTAVAPSNAVGAQVSQVNVQVTVSSSVIVYNRTVAGMLAVQLLSQQNAQALVSGYTQQGSPNVGVLRVFQQGKNGVIYISVPVREVWVYTISTKELEQWKQSIRGATRNAALAYLGVQGGVQAVQINLPLGTDHFPTAVDQIKIVVV